VCCVFLCVGYECGVYLCVFVRFRRRVYVCLCDVCALVRDVCCV